jgi:hypothetical protein
MGHESGPYCESPNRPPEPTWELLSMVYGGEPRRRWIFCVSSRSDEEMCGKDARWWTAKRPPWWRRITDTSTGVAE